MIPKDLKILNLLLIYSTNCANIRYMNSGGKTKKSSTQAYLPISEVKRDVVIMKDGSLRAVLLVSSLNFALKSDEEKDAIISSFQGFLNSLTFPVQLLSTSKKLDLSQYIEKIKQESQGQANPLLRIQSQEYVKFIETLLENSNIMEKRFYVVVPYFPAGINIENKPTDLLKKNKNTTSTNYDENKKKLLQRVEVIIQGIMSIGLRCSGVDTKGLLELYYTSYNPDTAENQRVLNVDDLDNQVVTTSKKGSL